MARSTYIYVVTEKGQLKAAFTVKHELERWLMRTDSPDAYELWRCQDGLYKDKDPQRMVAPEWISITIDHTDPGTA